MKRSMSVLVGSIGYVGLVIIVLSWGGEYE